MSDETVKTYRDYDQGKVRTIQEYVPGKQVTLLHVIAQPVDEVYDKLGLSHDGAIGILTLTPGETAIIAGDIATKSGKCASVFWIVLQEPWSSPAMLPA